MAHKVAPAIAAGNTVVLKPASSTPLTAVLGYAEALAEGDLPAEEVAQAGAVIRTEALRLQRRVEDLLALARMEADDFALTLGPVKVICAVA